MSGAVTPLDPGRALAALFLARFPAVPTAPPSSPGGGTIAVYSRLFTELHELSPEGARAAGGLAIARHTIANTLPTEGAVRAAFAEITQPPRRTGLEAWGDVRALLGRFSTHRHPSSADVADPLVWAGICAIGWAVICNSLETDSAPRAQFVRAYESKQESRTAQAIALTVPSVRALHAAHAGELAAEVVKRIGGAS